MTTITPELEQLVVNDFLTSNIHVKGIHKKYNVSKWFFKKISKKYNLPCKKYKPELIPGNRDYFETIDTASKAYWLGFIVGDGCVRYNKNAQTYVLAIKLCNIDFEHLEKFKTDIESSHTIRYYNTYNEKYDNIRYYTSIEISGEKLCKDLDRNGAKFNKSKELSLPNLPDNLMRHYLRGLIDADGCWHVRTGTTRMEFGFVSPVKNFIYEVMYFFMKKCDLRELKIIPNAANTCYSFQYGGSTQCRRIYEYLYGDGGPWLDRKYKLSKEFFDNTVKHPDYNFKLEHSHSKYVSNICKCKICELCTKIYKNFHKHGITLTSEKVTELSTKHLRLYETDNTYRKSVFYKTIRAEVDKLGLNKIKSKKIKSEEINHVKPVKINPIKELFLLNKKVISESA